MSIIFFGRSTSRATSSVHNGKKTTVFRTGAAFDETKLQLVVDFLLQAIRNSAIKSKSCECSLQEIVSDWKRAHRIRQLQEKINNLSKASSPLQHVSPLTHYTDFERLLDEVCQVLQADPSLVNKSQFWSQSEKADLLMGEVTVDESETVTVMQNLSRLGPHQAGCFILSRSSHRKRFVRSKQLRKCHPSLYTDSHTSPKSFELDKLTHVIVYVQ